MGTCSLTSATAACLQSSLWSLPMSREALMASGRWSRSTSTALCMPSAAPLAPELYSLAPGASWILVVKVLAIALIMRRLWRFPEGFWGACLVHLGAVEGNHPAAVDGAKSGGGNFSKSDPADELGFQAVGCWVIHSQCSPLEPPGPAPLFLGA